MAEPGQDQSDPNIGSATFHDLDAGTICPFFPNCQLSILITRQKSTKEFFSCMTS